MRENRWENEGELGKGALELLPSTWEEGGDILVFTYFLYFLTFLLIESFIEYSFYQGSIPVERGKVQIGSRI